MEQIQEIVVGGIPIALLVGLVVQALKVYGFVSGDNAAKAAIVVSVVLGLVGLGGEIFPEIQAYLELAVKYFAGAMMAGLVYEYGAAPFLEKLGIPIRSKSLK